MQTNTPRAIDSVIVHPKPDGATKRSRRNTFFWFARKKWFWPVTLGIVIIVSSGMFLWYQHTRADTPLNSEKQIVQAIGKLYILTTTEQPVLATVTDSTKLATPFLKQANNGDKVLIYVKAKIVIIYRPSVNKIVAVGPVDISPPPPVVNSGGH